MGDPPGQPELLLEALQQGGIQLPDVGPDCLDGQGLAHLPVERAVDHAHPAGAERLLDLVAAGEEVTSGEKALIVAPAFATRYPG